ncbi:branched-chain-amino-acid transaminase [Gammaproteobacteria bacterium 42_54_T18]|nr:branched-chain-amino-acid transaminase [Gammaproteobacteria bacterium 42_54_T18]
MNGNQCNQEDATLSIFDHGVLYGDGVFEGIRFYHHKPLLMHDHIERLFASANSLEIVIPYTTAELISAITNLCEQALFSHGYIRLVVTRGVGAIGLNPIGCGPANVFIIVAELNMMPANAIHQGITTIIATTRRISSSALDPRIKSLNYLNSILAKQEANRTNVDEAILLNDQNNVAEAVAENVFIVHKGKLITPPCDDGALNGITRKTILALAQESGIPYDIASIPEATLLASDEVFLTGTGAELIPVRSINGKLIPQCPGQIFSKLKVLYTGIIEQQT